MSAKNALKHGILSNDAVLPGEDAESLAQLAKRLRAELSPVGELEELLVDRITAAVWRLRRLGRVEAEVFTGEVLRHEAERASREAAKYQEPFDIGFVITNQEMQQKALRRAEEAEKKRSAATLGLAFTNAAEGPDTFSKLSRYETAIERSLYRSLHELQRLQAARGGQAVPPPVAVELGS